MIALIDGDILTYRLGFSTEGTSEGIVRSRVDGFITDLLLYHTGAEDFEGYLTFDRKENFRLPFAVTLPYKGQRTGRQPEYYDFIREYLHDKWGFQMVRGQEADDSIGIDAFTRWEQGQRDSYVICTIDKDLDMIPGKHFNFVKREHYEVDEWSGLVSFYTQILTGDRTDNVAGIRGVGPVKAGNLLADCRTEDELWRAVSKAYAENGGRDRIIENAMLLWIRRRPNEIWTPPDEREASIENMEGNL